jgi:hypothetical protein
MTGKLKPEIASLRGNGEPGTVAIKSGRMRPKARFRPDPEEHRRARLVRRRYRESVGMWPERSLRPAPGSPGRVGSEAMYQAANETALAKRLASTAEGV